MFGFTLNHHRTDGHNNPQCPKISALYVEDLRLWTSEIVLASQLKKEREKSQRIMTDAESAVRFYGF